MTDYVIECTAVRKQYKNTMALNGLDLQIPKGSVFGLLGKNGAGKTTLLKCMTGMVSYQSGSISVLGVSPGNLDATVKSRMGYVPQTIALYPWMTAQGLTEYVGSFYPRWNGQRVSKLLREWELKPDSKVGTFSVGQKQKLAIILALGHEPELLLLDEPAASLDPSARRQFLKAILDLCIEHNQTVVFSTHIMADIERVADSVGILNAGKTIFAGELGALKDSVKTLRLTAASPLPAVIEGRDILQQKVQGGEALLTVKDFSDATLARLKARYGAEIEVIDLTLEDIFLALNP